MKEANGTVTYLYRNHYGQDWKEDKARARITPKRIYMMPRAFDLTGRKLSATIPSMIKIVAYRLDGQCEVVIDKSGA